MLFVWTRAYCTAWIESAFALVPLPRCAVQDFSGAQLGFIRSYSFSSATQFASLAPGPTASDDPSSAAFRAQAQQIVDLSGNLTDYDKLIAEFSATVPLGSSLNVRNMRLI